jgi:hypothetical protein
MERIAMAAFTAKTQFEESEDTKPALLVYTDMRNHTWYVVQHGFGEDAEWWSYPSVETAKAYGLDEYTIENSNYPGNYFAMVFAGAPSKNAPDKTTSQLLIDAIEQRLELARAAGETPGEKFDRTPDRKFPWWLLILGALAWSSKKKRRR